MPYVVAMTGGLPDLCIHEVQSLSRVDTAYALGIVMDQGKTDEVGCSLCCSSVLLCTAACVCAVQGARHSLNLVSAMQEGRCQYALALRSRDVDACALGAVLLLLMVQWSVMDVRWPDFSSRPNW